VIPTDYQIKYGHYKLVDGVWHKRCTGPAHEEHEWLPANDKYFYIQQSKGREGIPTSRCRLCHQWNKLKSPGSHHGLVEVRSVQLFYIEVVNRIGMMELHRRSGLSLGHINRVLNGTTKYVRKEPVRRAMLELISARRRNEHSINKDSKWRQERRIASNMDLCPGCGIPKNDATRGCKTCRQRHYDRFTRKQITKKEWNRLVTMMEDRNE